jgi:hypothetical protein
MESIQYIVGSFLYLLSPAFREKKRRQWENQGLMVKIYEIGMWLTMPLIIVLSIVAITVLQHQ